MKDLPGIRWGAIGLLLLWLAACSRPEIAPPEIPSSLLRSTLVGSLTAARQLVLDQPQSSEAWGELGQWFQLAELPGQAVVCYQAAQRRAPENPQWWHLAGLLRLGDNPEAGISNLVKAAELAQGTTDAPRVALARALVERGREGEALIHLKQLLAFNGDHAAARLEMGRMELGRTNLEVAESWLGACLTNPVTAWPSRLLLSRIAQQRGNQQKAAEWVNPTVNIPRGLAWPDPYVKAVEALATDGLAQADRINGLLMQGRLAQAEAAMTNPATPFSTEAARMLLLGRLRYQQRRCAEAEALFRQVVKAETNSLNGWTQLGLAMMCQEQWQGAADAFKQAVRLKPDSAPAHHNLGVALARMGDREAAIASFREALRCNPVEPNTCALLADQLVRIGALQEAKVYVDRALRLNPRHPRALELRKELK